MGEAGYLQGLLPELWYGVVQTVHAGHHFSCGSDQIMSPRRDWRTPREVDVAVEHYADKGLNALKHSIDEDHSSFCLCHSLESKQVVGTLRRDCRTEVTANCIT